MDQKAMRAVAFSGKLGITVTLKFALNAIVPGASSLVDFAQAGKCFLYDGDISGGLINTAAGIIELCTCGLAGTAKEAMKESAKGTIVQTAKETAKSASKAATKKVGEDLSKQIAMGAIKGTKDAAIQTAKESAKTASKEATKKVGQKVAEGIARGVITEAVDEVLLDCSKMTFGQILRRLLLGTATVKDILEQTLTSGTKRVFSETLKQSNEEVVFEFFKNVAKTAAEEEFEKQSWKFIAKEIITEVINGSENN